MAPDAIVETLGMAPHPEGGWYVETWRATPTVGGRAAATAIYFLLEAGQRSHWHRVDAAEVWLWHAGEPLLLEVSADARTVETLTLGPDLDRGQRPQAVVAAGAWQAARPLGGWSLVSCIVVPGFEFAGFTLAPPGWRPG